MNAAPQRVLVIGGGISGLAAAYRLRQRHPQADLRLIEASPRLGGVIRTTVHDGLICEHGPDSLLTAKPAGLRLITDLGLETELVGVPPTARRALIARGHRLLPVPDGLYLLAPGKLRPFLASGLCSPLGMLRMGFDLFLPRRAAAALDEDAPEESLAQFVTRRLGREALDRIAQPLIGGISTGDPRRLSVAATFPQFLHMEREHGSLIKAMRARTQSAGEAAAQGPRYGLFVSLRGGLQRLIDALAAQLTAHGVVLCPQQRALALTRAGKAWQVAIAAADGSTTHHTADFVVLAVPGPAAAALLRPLDAMAGDLLAGVPYASVATISLAFAVDQLPPLPPAAGFVVPTIERRHVIACTFASEKYPGRAPTGTVLLRAFVGGALNEAHLAGSDAELTERVLADLRDWLGVRNAPRFTLVQRWPQAMAQYTVDRVCGIAGHLARTAALKQRLAALPGLRLISNATDGVGIPDLCAQAEGLAS